LSMRRHKQRHHGHHERKQRRQISGELRFHHARFAPPALIRADLEHCRERHELCTTPDISDLIYIQSIEGHAHEGHSVFRGKRYVNTTIDDIVRAIGWDPNEVLQERQELIDEISHWAALVIKGEAPDRLVTPDGAPLLGVECFAELTVNPAEVMKGMYLGGRMDDLASRRPAEERYGVNIGGGKLYAVNVRVMEELGLDGERLAKTANADKIAEYQAQGMIVEEVELYQNPEVQYMYIRHRLGAGVSDDACIVGAGLLFGRSVSAALGAFFADAVDTLEKYAYCVYPIDQDGELSLQVADRVTADGVDDDLVTKYTYLVAAAKSRPGEVPDSSLRHMIEYDRNSHQFTLESHLNFLTGKPYQEMELGFERVSNTAFYRYIEEKLKTLDGREPIR